MQLTFPFAPATRAIRAPATKRGEVPHGTGKLPPSGTQALTVAEALNRGIKVAFPKDANAIRVAFGSKTTVLLKADADTLRGAGVATAVEFGTVKNDAKGHPIRKGFAALATRSAKPSTDRADGLARGALVLSCQ